MFNFSNVYNFGNYIKISFSKFFKINKIIYRPVDNTKSYILNLIYSESFSRINTFLYNVTVHLRAVKKMECKKIELFPE